MKFLKHALTGLGAMCLAVAGGAALAQNLTVGVSWNNFQEERWKTDEAAIVSALNAAGAKYISTDAQSSAEKQASDVENLIAQGANALIHFNDCFIQQLRQYDFTVKQTGSVLISDTQCVGKAF